MSDTPSHAESIGPSRDRLVQPRYRQLVIRYGPDIALVVPGHLVGRAIVVSLVGSAVGVFYGGGWLFQRWAPNLDAVAMTCLTTWTWMHHLVEIRRRRQPLGGGVARAVAYTSVMAVIVIAGNALVGVIGSR